MALVSWSVGTKQHSLEFELICVLFLLEMNDRVEFPFRYSFKFDFKRLHDTLCWSSAIETWVSSDFILFVVLPFYFNLFNMS